MVKVIFDINFEGNSVLLMVQVVKDPWFLGMSTATLAWNGSNHSTVSYNLKPVLVAIIAAELIVLQ
jgi:hypothetical protein